MKEGEDMFAHEGVIYIAIAAISLGDTCRGCAFYGRGDCPDFIPACESGRRVDGREVIWIACALEKHKEFI